MKKLGKDGWRAKVAIYGYEAADPCSLFPGAFTTYMIDLARHVAMEQ